LRARMLDVDLEVVLQVLADPWQVVSRLDACSAQMLRVAHPRELEELWRVDRSAAEDHLAGEDPLAGDRLDAPRARSVEEHARHVHAAADLEVRPAARRSQVRGRRAPSAPSADRTVEARETLLAVAVDVVGERIPRLLDGCEERLEERRVRRTAL